jgi:hypothetical protein
MLYCNVESAWRERGGYISVQQHSFLKQVTLFRQSPLLFHLNLFPLFCILSYSAISPHSVFSFLLLLLSWSRNSRLRPQGIRRADHATSLYPQKLALTSPTSGCLSVGIVRSRTKATELLLLLILLLLSAHELFYCTFYAVLCSVGTRSLITWSP